MFYGTFCTFVSVIPLINKKFLMDSIQPFELGCPKVCLSRFNCFPDKTSERSHAGTMYMCIFGFLHTTVSLISSYTYFYTKNSPFSVQNEWFSFFNIFFCEGFRSTEGAKSFQDRVLTHFEFQMVNCRRHGASSQSIAFFLS